MLERILDWIGIEKHEIGRQGLTRYLTRWVLCGKRDPETGLRRWGPPSHRVFIHWFHNGDPESYLHDHPWSFWSLIIWGGYWEHTESGKRWYGPLRLLRRPANWRHRVELPDGRRCWTLVWTGSKERSWGFWCPRGFMPWRQHDSNMQAGIPGCGE
jgi:hypothetical protein